MISRDLALIVEAEPLLGAAGEQVEVAAHRPEEALGAVELAELRGGQQAGLDQVGRTSHAVDIFADPVERVEVAKAALALLDVGLDDVAAVAHPACAARRARRASPRRTRRPCRRRPPSGSGACDRVEQLLVAPQPARLEQGGADGHVLLARARSARRPSGPNGRPSASRSHSRWRIASIALLWSGRRLPWRSGT